jgi:hypothetical protein
VEITMIWKDWGNMRDEDILNVTMLVVVRRCWFIRILQVA